MPKRTAKFDMQRSYRGNIQTINGCICRKRRSNLTCGARFTQTNALGSQLNGSVHLDPAGITCILDGGIKPVGWSFDSGGRRPAMTGTGERYAGRLPPESSNAKQLDRVVPWGLRELNSSDISKWIRRSPVTPVNHVLCRDEK